MAKRHPKILSATRREERIIDGRPTIVTIHVLKPEEVTRVGIRDVNYAEGTGIVRERKG